jgi:hypothetical protein
MLVPQDVFGCGPRLPINASFIWTTYILAGARAIPSLLCVDFFNIGIIN